MFPALWQALDTGCIQFPQQSHEVDNSIIPTLHIKKPRLKDIMGHPQGHTAGKQGKWRQIRSSKT